MILKKTLLGEKLFYSFLTFSFIELAFFCGMLIDSFLVANFLSENAVAAVGIGSPMFSMIGIFDGLLSVGMQTACSAELGKGNVREFNRIFSAVMYFGIILSVIITVVTLISAAPIAFLLGARGSGAVLCDDAASYIRGISIGFPALVLYPVFASACQMDSDGKRVMASTIIGVAINVILDILVIFMHGGLFEIGLASSFAYSGELIYLLLHFLKKDRMLCIVPFKTNFRELISVLYNGTEKALHRTASLLCPIFLNPIVIACGGVAAMTALSIQDSLLGFAGFFAAGLSDTTSLMVGILYGEKDGESIQSTGKIIHRLNFIFAGALGILFIGFASPIARAYVRDTATLGLTVFAVRMTGVFAFTDGLVRSRIAYLQAIRKTKNMQALLLISTLVYVIAIAAVLGYFFGAFGVLASYPAADILALITVGIFYMKKTGKAIPSVDDYLALPSDFHIYPGDVISLDIRDLYDVSLVSEQIQLFCKGHKIDKKLSYYAALCFEELAKNTIEHGFPKCRRAPAMDFRMVFSKDELILRLKDNCPGFDVERHLAMTASGEGEPGIGFRLLTSMSQNIRYVHTLDMNNIIITFPFKNPTV